MNIQILEEAGLTRNEALVYFALLDQGASKAGHITRRVGIHRRNVYDAIEMLIQKGLVSYIKENNVRLYLAVSPNRLLEILKEKEQNLTSMIPELEKRFTAVQKKNETIFFRGKQALKSLFDDQLKENKEILILGACPFAKDIIKYYFQKYDKERQHNKILVKALFTNRIKYKIPLSEIKYLPKEIDSPTATNIYGNNVAIILWSEEPFAILIKQKEIADSYRNYFNLLWKTAKN
jgi:sugar-specific transcriptional regulator TrmB